MRDKIRDMQRSILPSKMRYAHELKKLNSRRHRRTTRALCHQADLDTDFQSVDLERDYCLAQRACCSHGSIIQNRREADKLSHFEHWFYRRVLSLGLKTQKDRQDLADCLCPTNSLIGWHAQGHLSSIIEDGENPRDRTWRRRYDSPRKRLQLFVQSNREYLLHWVIDHRLLQDLNTHLYSKHRYKHRILGFGWETEHYHVWLREPPWREARTRRVFRTYSEAAGPDVRLLRGLWDVQAFLEDLQDATRGGPLGKVQYEHKTPLKSGEIVSDWRRQENPWHHPEWLGALDEFLLGLY